MMRVRLTAAGLGFSLMLVLGARAAQAACADGTWEEGIEECDDGNTVAGDGCAADCTVECTEIGLGATDHTCGHGAFGPFVTTSAQKYPGFVYSDVSSPHTYFTVALAGTAGIDHSGVVFSPGVNDAYAIYMKTKFPLTVRDSTGTEVPLLLEHAVSSCSVPDSITWVKTFRLTNEDTYTLDIGPSTETSVSFALESLSGFSESWYLDADHDGWGGKPVSQSWCKRPVSYVGFGDDCDDSKGAINPGARESCDGIDANCDFSVDTETADLCGDSTTGSVCRETSKGVACGCDDDSNCAQDTACNADTHQCEAPDLGAGGAGGAQGAAGSDAGGEADADTGAAGSGADSALPGGTTAGGASGGTPKGGQANTGGGSSRGGRASGGKAGDNGNQDDRDDSGCQFSAVGPTRSIGFGWAGVALALGVALRRRRARL